MGWVGCALAAGQEALEFTNVSSVAIPLPASLPLLVTALGGVVLLRRRGAA